MTSRPSVCTVGLEEPLLRGPRRPRAALVGRMGVGRSTVFQGAASAIVGHERLAGEGPAYEECIVDVGLDQISLVDLPPLESLHGLDEAGRVVLKYLLWGDRWPAVARHESRQPAVAFQAPDVLVLVVDATALQRDLELAQELSLLGRPLVIALNRMDEARDKGLYINVRALAEALGVPVVPTVAHMGKGLRELFTAVVRAARENVCPLPQQPSPHVARALEGLATVVAGPAIAEAFRVPRPLLLTQLAEKDDYFLPELAAHFPESVAALDGARVAAERDLPRPLADEIHADRHHRSALLFESVSRPGRRDESAPWQFWLDEIFLHPRWGLVGSTAIFALVLFLVFEVATGLDALTSARLAAWVGEWTPGSTAGVVGRAVADALVGLVGIVVPYMLPLVLLLVALEESGIMHRVAFVVDRGFHRIGLHGGVALPFLMGLGCNVPAISAATAVATGRDRIVAAVLITFVPCSARSAIILALGGKYLGPAGVLGLFALILVVIAVAGRLLGRRYSTVVPGVIQDIPPYALPRAGAVLRATWERTSDILTIVTPLLIAGSVVLALLAHVGADAAINTLLTPITSWWLGLPIALGVPILFGVLRKELSLLMVAQALGTAEVGNMLDAVQITTFLAFLTFYIPCVSTFAVMLRLIGTRQALFSIGISVASALAISGAVRLPLELWRALA